MIKPRPATPDENSNYTTLSCGLNNTVPHSATFAAITVDLDNLKQGQVYQLIIRINTPTLRPDKIQKKTEARWWAPRHDKALHEVKNGVVYRGDKEYEYRYERVKFIRSEQKWKVRQGETHDTYVFCDSNEDHTYRKVDTFSLDRSYYGIEWNLREC
jgi:hypothetical protein